MTDREAALVNALIEVGQRCDQRGWVPATSGNFSARATPDSVLITRSGCHKGRLQPRDFIQIDLRGHSFEQGTPSYETGLHLQIYRQWPESGCVLHVHSKAATILSRRGDVVCLQGYELLKVFPASPDPEKAIEIPVFENEQNIERLCIDVQRRFIGVPDVPAYLIRGHGLYVWGPEPSETLRRVEALEFMLECKLIEQGLNR